MIYSLVILLCTTDGSQCITQTIPNVFQNERQCEVAKTVAEIQIDREEGVGGMARCVNWGQPA